MIPKNGALQRTGGLAQATLPIGGTWPNAGKGNKSAVLSKDGRSVCKKKPTKYKWVCAWEFSPIRQGGHIKELRLMGAPLTQGGERNKNLIGLGTVMDRCRASGLRDQKERASERIRGRGGDAS